LPAVKVIEDEPFGANGGPLDHHPCPARDEEQDDVRADKLPGDAKPDILNLEDLPRSDTEKFFGSPGARNAAITPLQHRCSGRLSNVLPAAQLSLQFAVHLPPALWDVRPAKRPAASERHVHAQAEFACLVRRKAQIIDKFIAR